jgi:hypothetical protein
MLFTTFFRYVQGMLGFCESHGTDGEVESLPWAMGTKNYLHINTTSIQSAIIRPNETKDSNIGALEKDADGVNVYSLTDQIQNNVVTVRCCSNGTNGRLKTHCSTKQLCLAKSAVTPLDLEFFRSSEVCSCFVKL